jgi:hypothetical protein
MVLNLSRNTCIIKECKRRVDVGSSNLKVVGYHDGKKRTYNLKGRHGRLYEGRAMAIPQVNI